MLAVALLGFYSTNGQLTVQPTLIYKCPNETVSFTCTGRQIMSLAWIMEPYFDESDGFSYIVDFVVQMTVETSFRHTRYISSNVTNITEVNGSRADMTTIKPFNVNNGTIITCKSETNAYGTLFLAGKKKLHFLKNMSLKFS